MLPFTSIKEEFGIRRARFNREIKEVASERNLARLRWLGHAKRMVKDRPAKERI